jgi:hypothetical protein
MEAVVVLADSRGRGAKWTVDIDPDRPYQKIPMSILVEAQYVCLVGRSPLKNKLGGSINSVKIGTAVECWKGEGGGRKLVGLKTLEGFSLGKTDAPIFWVTLNSEGYVVAHHTSLESAKASAEPTLLGFDIRGTKVAELVNNNGKYLERKENDDT